MNILKIIGQGSHLFQPLTLILNYKLAAKRSSYTVGMLQTK